MEHFVVLSNAKPYKKETSIAVTIMITCKIALIWCHMKALY